MQEYNQFPEARFVLEHIHQVFLGEEVPITCAFNKYAIAKVQRQWNEIDYVAVKWDFNLYVPIVIFDPNCINGTIEKLLCLYVYEKVGEIPKPKSPKTIEDFTKSPDKMSGDEMYLELKMFHGLTDAQCKQYRSMPARKAKVLEMRRLLTLAGNGK